MKILSDPEHCRAGYLGPINDAVEGRWIYTNPLSQFPNCQPVFSCKLFYNFSDRISHGKDNCISVSDICQGGITVSDIGQRIRKIMEMANLTQKEFAKTLNLAQSTVSEYISGKTTPSDKVLLLISKTFNISYHWLKTGEGEMFEKEKGMRVEELKIP